MLLWYHFGVGVESDGLVKLYIGPSGYWEVHLGKTAEWRINMMEEMRTAATRERISSALP